LRRFLFFFSSRRRHTRFDCDWSSDVCSSDLGPGRIQQHVRAAPGVAGGVSRGAYVLLDPPGATPQAILIATGSEVHVALAAAKRSEERRVGRDGTRRTGTESSWCGGRGGGTG